MGFAFLFGSRKNGKGTLVNLPPSYKKTVHILTVFFKVVTHKVLST